MQVPLHPIAAPRLPLTLLLCLGGLLGLASGARAQESPPSGGAAAGVAGEAGELAEMLRTGRYAEAEEWRAEEPNRFPLLWALLLRETGRSEAALALIETHASFVAGEAGFLVAAAALLQEKGELARAKEHLRRVIRDDATPIALETEARTRLGQIFVREGLREDGREQFTAVIESYKKLSAADAKKLPAETFVWMGRAAEGLERFQEAYEVLYSTAFDRDKGSVAAHVASGWILFAKYNYPDARSHFEDALGTNPNHAEAHIGLARAIYADYGYPGERFQDTRLHLAEAERVWKGHPESRMLEGDIAFYDEVWEDAERHYRAAIELDPTDLWRKGRLAALFFATARMTEFDAYCAEVEASHPAAAPLYGSLAERLVDRFFYVEAADFAKKAVELDAQYWPAYVVLGINALRAGREEEGREYVRKALDADPFNVWAFNTLQLIKRIDRTFTERRDEDFVIRMPEGEAPYLMSYLDPLLRETRDRMERLYEEAVHRPITVEDFSEHQYFSARSIGLPGLAASGVCFGRMVTLTTPHAIPGNWGAVAVHEFAHVVTLAKAKHRIPRWFGEGLSVFEEGRAQPRWRRHYADEWVSAVHAGEILGMSDIQQGFTRPSWPGQILLSYYQGGVLCTFIERDWGFPKILAMLTAYREGKSTIEVFREVLGVSLEEFDARFAKYARELADSFGIGPEWSDRSLQKLQYHTEDHPQDAAGWLRLGFAYWFNRKKADAELALGKAAELAPEHADVAALRGFLAFQDDRKQTARAELAKAIERGTIYPYRCRVALAILEAGAGAQDRAIELLEEAIAIHPDGVRPRFGQPNPYLQLAKLLEDRGDKEEAVATLERVVATDRDDFPTRKRLAEIWSAAQNWEKVIECAWDAPYIVPYDQDVHRMLGRAYFETAAYGLAKRELEVQLASELPPPPINEIFPMLAYCHWKLGDLEKARDFAGRAQKLVPEDPRVKEVLEALGEPPAGAGGE